MQGVGRSTWPRLKMSRNNLEYGAIIDADDDNDGDLVFPSMVVIG